MILSPAQRERLQKSITRAIPVMADGDRKKCFLIILALIQDLNEAETANGLEKHCLNLGYRFVVEIQKAMEGCKKIAATEAGGISKQNRAFLAEKMKLVSDNLFILGDILSELQEGPCERGALQ